MDIVHPEANIGDIIKARDWAPRGELVEDYYLLGRVFEKGFIKEVGFEGYTVLVTGHNPSNRAYEIAEKAYVPFELVFDFKDRIEIVN